MHVYICVCLPFFRLRITAVILFALHSCMNEFESALDEVLAQVLHSNKTGCERQPFSTLYLSCLPPRYTTTYILSCCLLALHTSKGCRACVIGICLIKDCECLHLFSNIFFPQIYIFVCKYVCHLSMLSISKRFLIR